MPASPCFYFFPLSRLTPSFLEATAPETRDRWPQQHHESADFNMMHNYDRQTTATAYVPRPEMPYHFPLGAFNPAPMATPASPQYDAPASYGVYNQYGAQPMLDAPFKPQESLVHQGSVQEDVDGLQFVKSENISTLPNSPCPTAVDPNAQAQATPTYQLYTPIDNVMRVINSMREILEPANKAVMAQIEEKQAPKEAQVR